MAKFYPSPFSDSAFAAEDTVKYANFDGHFLLGKLCNENDIMSTNNLYIGQ